MRLLLGSIFLFVGSHLSSLGIYCVCAAEPLAAPLCVKYLCSMHVYSVTKSCPTLCNPMDCSLPGSSVHGIFLVRILEWVAISFSRGSTLLRDQTCVLCFLHWQADSLALCHLLLLLLNRFSRVRLCDPTDGSPPGSAVPGILKARTLEWVVISFSNA